MIRPTSFELFIDRWRHPLAAICFALSCASAYCGVVDVREHEREPTYEKALPPAETITEKPVRNMPAANAGASTAAVIAFAYERMPRL